MITIGQKLKYLREKKDLKRKDIAKYLDITLGYISLYENDKRGITLDRLAKLLNFYGIEFAEFFADIENMDGCPTLPLITPWEQLESGQSIELNLMIREDAPHYLKKPMNSSLLHTIVPDDKMFPRFLEGDIIGIDSNAPFENGSRFLVRINAEIIFSFYHEFEDKTVLSYANEKYGERSFKKGVITNKNKIGKVIEMIPKL